MLFAIGVATTIGAAQLSNPAFFELSALLIFASLGFFVFTEAFLLPPPHRKKIDIWSARIFLVPNVLAVLDLVVSLVTRAL